MADDDDDESAGEVDEPEMDVQAAKAAASASRDDDDDDGTTVDFRGGGSPDNASVVRRGRVVSEKTRELFKKAADTIKAQLGPDGEDDDDSFGETEEPATRTEDTPVAAGAHAQAGQGGPQNPPPTPAAAPAPTLDPQVAKLREDYANRHADLEKREAAIAERERTGDLGQVREQYLERGAVAIRDMVRGWMPKDTTDDGFREEIADLITDLTANVLGVEVPAEVQNALRSKRAVKGLEAYKARERARDEAQKKQAEEAATRDGETRASAAMTQELQNPERPHIKAFPFLLAEDSPGDIVLDVLKAQLRQDGTELPWTEAAKRANDYLKQQWQRSFDKRRHLLSAAPEGAANGRQADRPQGDPSGIRRSQTISNATAATPPPQTPKPPEKPAANGKWSREAHRENIKRKYREAFKPTED